MPKKFSITDKKKWLEDYENGKPEASIAGDSSCDLRTIRRGIEEARRGRDAQTARIDLLKRALLNHQEHLLNKLEELLSTLTMPAHDWAALSWVEDDQSILTESDLNMEDSVEDEVSHSLKKSDVRTDVEDLADVFV